MKLIGAGLPRTGTLSQKIALEMLGLAPCYHMVNVLGMLDETERWRQVLHEQLSIDEIFGDFEATVDWPGSFFTEDLIEVYPDAKVLLSVRSGESWARSMRDTIWGVLYGDTFIRHVSEAWRSIEPRWDAYMSLMDEMWKSSGLMEDENTTAAYMSDAMIRYNEAVKRTVPADRLLVWSVADGWEPLCEFLGVAVPDEPLPHANDRGTFLGRVIDGGLAALAQWREQHAKEFA
jgi:hypothetical protein